MDFSRRALTSVCERFVCSACKTQISYISLQSLHRLSVNSAVVLQIKYFLISHRKHGPMSQGCCVWSHAWVSPINSCYNSASQVCTSLQNTQFRPAFCIGKVQPEANSNCVTQPVTVSGQCVKTADNLNYLETMLNSFSELRCKHIYV